MGEPKIPVNMHAVMRLDRDPDKDVRLDLADLHWKAHGLDEIGPLSPVMLDLMEIARTVHEFDRRRPKRSSGVRVRSVDVKMPVREPERWTAGAKEELCSLLRIQGNTDWAFEFRQRARRTANADIVFPTRAITRSKAAASAKAKTKLSTKAVVLFSGGLDSTSGLATIREPTDSYLLVSYYSGNLTQQQSIAKELGFNRLLQIGADWTNTARSGYSGGQFWYRSFLFLALAAAFADATSASSVLQFENGPLALSVPPLDIYRITRHAHPSVHEHMEKLVKRLTGRDLIVSNPFLNRTKAEAVGGLRARLAPASFKRVVFRTESCWYLKSLTIIAGPKRKKNGQACGACIPCLIRRASLKSGEDRVAGVDFTKKRDPIAADPVVRVHFEAYSEFANRLLDPNYNLYEFLEEAPSVTRSAMTAGNRIGAADAFALYRRFAREWRKAFA